MQFLTLKNSGTSEFRDRGSKFYGLALPVDSLSEFKKKLAGSWETHPSATHICYGYRLYINGHIEEFAGDDGEPRGSSGPPILNVLRRNDIINAAIFVTRYYGGSKLGIPGLIHAYGTAAEKTLETIRLFKWKPTITVSITTDYALQRLIDQILANTSAELVSQKFDARIVIQFRLAPEEFDSFAAYVQEISAGKLTAEKSEENDRP